MNRKHRFWDKLNQILWKNKIIIIRGHWEWKDCRYEWSNGEICELEGELRVGNSGVASGMPAAHSENWRSVGAQQELARQTTAMD